MFVADIQGPPSKFINFGNTFSNVPVARFIINYCYISCATNYDQTTGKNSRKLPQQWFKDGPRAHKNLLILFLTRNTNTFILLYSYIPLPILQENSKVGDRFMNQIEPMAAYVPYMTCPGNHEEAW